MYDITEHEKAMKELEFISLKRQIERDGNDKICSITKN